MPTGPIPNWLSLDAVFHVVCNHAHHEEWLKQHATVVAAIVATMDAVMATKVTLRNTVLAISVHMGNVNFSV
jgi:hypothetical protein